MCETAAWLAAGEWTAQRRDDRLAAAERLLALYRSLLGPLYPGHEIRAGLLFTEAPVLIDIPAEAMEAAMRRRANVAGTGTVRQALADIA